ncbi:ribosomal protein L19 family protein [Actinidia rufa]|uniref:Ribosomal protein L19 family protein n=1 Tax=Actinidia rufa TaxID=165716 RepID=A0A7J0G0A1_9ERIC|nr:ribosomal protein L19 family protein [Actinidia rufa]
MQSFYGSIRSVRWHSLKIVEYKTTKSRSLRPVIPDTDKVSFSLTIANDKEAVEEVKNQREIPDIKPGYIIQLKVEVPDNKRRVSILKGIVIARRNAGLNTTFRLRRLVAGVGVESLFPLYSPNIKEIKVLDKKKVRRAKLYYLRDRMNPLKK